MGFARGERHAPVQASRGEVPLLTDLSDQRPRNRFREHGRLRRRPPGGAQHTDWSGFRQGVRDRLPGVGFGRVIAAWRRRGRRGNRVRDARSRRAQLIVVDTIHERRQLARESIGRGVFRTRARWTRRERRRCRARRASSTPRRPGCRGHPGLPLPASSRGTSGSPRSLYFPLGDRTAAARRDQLGCRALDEAAEDGRVSGGGGVSIVHRGLQADAARMRGRLRIISTRLSGRDR